MIPTEKIRIRLKAYDHKLLDQSALDIVDTAPAIKGASASARSKPATCSTGLVVQVPEYLENGERIKVNTQDARYMSRE